MDLHKEFLAIDAKIRKIVKNNNINYKFRNDKDNWFSYYERFYMYPVYDLINMEEAKSSSYPNLYFNLRNDDISLGITYHTKSAMQNFYAFEDPRNKESKIMLLDIFKSLPDYWKFTISYKTNYQPAIHDMIKSFPCNLINSEAEFTRLLDTISSIPLAKRDEVFFSNSKNKSVKVIHQNVVIDLMNTCVDSEYAADELFDQKICEIFRTFEKILNIKTVVQIKHDARIEKTVNNEDKELKYKYENYKEIMNYSDIKISSIATMIKKFPVREKTLNAKLKIEQQYREKIKNEIAELEKQLNIVAA